MVKLLTFLRAHCALNGMNTVQLPVTIAPQWFEPGKHYSPDTVYGVTSHRGDICIDVNLTQADQPPYRVRCHCDNAAGTVPLGGINESREGCVLGYR